MGSTSGTRAGDREMVLWALFGDTIPTAAPVAVRSTHTLMSNAFKPFASKWHFSSGVTFAFALSGAFVFDCGGLSFVLLVLQVLSLLSPNLNGILRGSNLKYWLDFLFFISIWNKSKEDSLVCLSLASPSTLLPTSYWAPQRLRTKHTNRMNIIKSRLWNRTCLFNNYSPKPGCSAFMFTLYSLQNTWYAVVVFFLG